MELRPTTEEEENCPQRCEFAKKNSSVFLDFFSFQDLKSILTVFTRRRAKRRQKLLILGFSLVVLVCGPNYGERELIN